MYTWDKEQIRQSGLSEKCQSILFNIMDNVIDENVPFYKKDMDAYFILKYKYKTQIKNLIKEDAELFHFIEKLVTDLDYPSDRYPKVEEYPFSKITSDQDTLMSIIDDFFKSLQSDMIYEIYKYLSDKNNHLIKLVNKDNQFYYNYFKGVCLSNKNYNIYIIVFLEQTIHDYMHITHEIAHMISSYLTNDFKSPLFSSYNIFCEFESLLFEQLMLNFLINNGFNKDEIEAYRKEKQRKFYLDLVSMRLEKLIYENIHLFLTEEKERRLITSKGFLLPTVHGKNDLKINYSYYYALINSSLLAKKVSDKIISGDESIDLYTKIITSNFPNTKSLIDEFNLDYYSNQDVKSLVLF